MKKILLALVPIVFLAAAQQHQAFGPIRFGMTGEAFRALGQLQTEIFRSAPANERVRMANDKSLYRLHFTAAVARKYFVSNGSKFTPRLAAKDTSVPATIETKPAHPAQEGPLTEVSVVSDKQSASTYGDAKVAWEVFQDIGSCKLSRVGNAGVFPALEQFGGTAQDIVTDTWEGEGVRIELVMRAAADPVTTAMQYFAVLRATEIAQGTASR